MIIAIDGPAGSGKSSTARALAKALSGFYLDTGAMYRAMALAFHRAGAPISEASAEDFIDTIRVDLMYEDDDIRVFLDGEDVSSEIRSPEVTEYSSRVSRLATVRRKLVSEQRRLAGELDNQGHHVVVEGRDIGTVVFPNAHAKFFMTANARVRAERRKLDLSRQGVETDIRSVMEDIERRDRQDSEREHSPLIQAQDAVVIDTTRLSPEEQLEHVLRTVRALDEQTES